MDEEVYSDDNKADEGENEEVDENYFVNTPKELNCRKYSQAFRSRTSLFKHVYANSCNLASIQNVKQNQDFPHSQPPEDCQFQKTAKTPTFSGDTPESPPESPQIVEATPIGPVGVSITGYTYATMETRFTPDGTDYTICIDSGCSRPLVDAEWIAKHPDAKIDYSQYTFVKGIGARRKLQGLATFTLYVPGKIEDTPSLGKITVRAWVTDKLEPKLLLGNEFLYPHGATINYVTCHITIAACQNLQAPITVRHKGTRIIRKVLAAKRVVIPPKSTVAVPVFAAPLPKTDRTFLFEGTYDGAQDAICDAVNFVTVINTSL
jgi:hypothetical protein